MYTCTFQLKKGKDCIALVERAYTDITRGYLVGIKKKLKEIKRISNELAELSEQKDNEVEKVVEEYTRETEEIQRKIGELGCQLEENKKLKCELEAALSGKQTKLATEQKTLIAAERELHGAKKKKPRRRKKKGGLVIAIGTKCGGPIGTIIGAAAGASAAGMFSGDIHAARTKVYRCKERVLRAESDVSSTRKELSDVETQIASLSQQYENLEKQQLQCNDEARKMREAVLFFRRAAMY